MVLSLVNSVKIVLIWSSDRLTLNYPKNEKTITYVYCCIHPGHFYHGSSTNDSWLYCSDFIATDINGTQWHLYDILATGKPVYIDVSATGADLAGIITTVGHWKIFTILMVLGTNELMVFLLKGMTTLPMLIFMEQELTLRVTGWRNSLSYHW